MDDPTSVICTILSKKNIYYTSVMYIFNLFSSSRLTAHSRYYFFYSILLFHLPPPLFLHAFILASLPSFSFLLLCYSSVPPFFFLHLCPQLRSSPLHSPPLQKFLSSLRPSLLLFGATVLPLQCHRSPSSFPPILSSLCLHYRATLPLFRNHNSSVHAPR